MPDTDPIAALLVAVRAFQHRESNTSLFGHDFNAAYVLGQELAAAGVTLSPAAPPCDGKVDSTGHEYKCAKCGRVRPRIDAEIAQRDTEWLQIVAEARAAAALDTTPAGQSVYVIIDGPISHESGRFVEVETEDGRSVKVGVELDPEGGGFWRIGPFALDTTKEADRAR